MSAANLRNYGRLKELLEAQEKFPLQFTFKIIGINTKGFAEGVAEFEAQFPKMKRQSSRKSAKNAHVSITYTILAETAAEITWIYEQASAIQDVKILL